MQEIHLKKLETLEEMLPQFTLIKQLTHTLSEEQYASYLAQMLPHRYYQVVAILDNQVVGVSGYWLLTKIYSGPYLEIDNFVVDENVRSKGIGEKLLQFMEHEALHNGCNVMMLDAYLENTAGHAFYQKHGFTPKGYHFIKHV